MTTPSTFRLKSLFVLIFTIVVFLKTNAQDLSDPGQYMTAINNAQVGMDKTYLAYMSAVAHNGRAKKVEKMRQQTLESIQNCKYKISDLPFYKGDNSLRKSSMDYIDMCYRVFNDDYAHVVNMEELIDQSFDEMQLYILLQEEIEKKLHDAADKMDSAGHLFATKYNVKIIETKDEISQNMEITSKVTHYRDQLYLLFYKCNWQDGEIIKAINAKKISGLEESRNALDTYAKEGLAALDSLNNFSGDHALAQACKQALEFYQKLAENDMVKVSDFYLKEENFNKIKKAIDSKPQNSLTKAEVDNYNKAVNDYNTSINTYNQVNNKINEQRTQVVNNWNNASTQFLDTHIPHMKS